MRCVALIPGVAILVGVVVGARWPAIAGAMAAGVLVISLLAAFGAWMLTRGCVVVASCAVGFFLIGVTLGAGATRDALASTLRDTLDSEIGGFSLDALGPPAAHQPIRIRVRLSEDAVSRDGIVSVHARIETIRVADVDRVVRGGILLGIAGSVATSRVTEWRLGRRFDVPVTFHRPARYLNDGIPDFERDLALDGTTLLATIKSALLVELVERGSYLEEAAASLRARVRRAVARWVTPHDAVAGAIVTAVLIGDRTGLPGEVRARLQAAGTYHVIAISGGNIAILAAALAALLAVAGVRGRVAAAVIIGGVLGYGSIVAAGPSVSRATTMAVTYLVARVLDHRSPPWNAMAVSAGALACASPLDVGNVGFALTFGATAAIVEAARRVREGLSVPGWARWPVATVLASVAVEIALMPIGAVAFSRVTAAGLLLNLFAIPLMTIAEIGGLVVALADGAPAIPQAAGLIAAKAADALVRSASLVEVAPWLTTRVPPPHVVLVIAYYLALSVALVARTRRVNRAAGVVLAGCLLAIVVGAPGILWPSARSTLRLIAFDVGQGDALLLELPTGQNVMIDTGGVGFGSSGFDIGARVLAPALWARGVRRLNTLALTHGDPDHIGGAATLADAFAPRSVWVGIPVDGYAPLDEVLAAARRAGARVTQRLAGASWTDGAVSLRVLHPKPPEWERQRVRNDDSLVIEVRYGDVAMLLTGDMSAGIERSLIPQLSSAKVRILKVAHHGSRTSTSAELLAAWRPQLAVISCGRGNRFGHPAPEVLGRLEAAGATVFRTDRDGQITIETNGHDVWTRTYVSRQ
jgi:competence protein ComEC